MNFNNMAVPMDSLMAAVQQNADGTVTLRFLQCDESGSVHVDLKGSDVLPPESGYYIDTLSILAAGINTPITAGDISGYSHGVIVVKDTAETIALTAFLDDAHAIETGAILVYTTAGVATAASALASGTYYIRDMAFKAIKATKSANVNAATINVAFKS